MNFLNVSFVSGNMMHVDYLSSLVALAAVGVVFLQWPVLAASRAELLVFVACLGAQVKQVRDVLDMGSKMMFSEFQSAYQIQRQVFNVTGII